MTDQVPEGPRAGWYPDPHGAHQYRYWGGTQWTEHVSDDGVPSVDGSGGPRGTPAVVSRDASATPARLTSTKKKPWLAVVVIAAAVAVLAVIAVALLVGGLNKGPATAVRTERNALGRLSEPGSAVAQARSAFDKEFGSFPAISKEGTRSAVIDLPAGVGGCMVASAYGGFGNFSVRAYDGSNRDLRLLALADGPYKGALLVFSAFGITRDPGDQVAKIKVHADGPWTVTVSPVSAAPLMTDESVGTLDDVHMYLGKASTFSATNKGTSTFEVGTFDASGGGTTLVSGVGDCAGTARSGEGPFLVEVMSDGSWTIKVDQAPTGTGAATGASTPVTPEVHENPVGSSIIDTPQGKFLVTGAEIAHKFVDYVPEAGRVFVIVHLERTDGASPGDADAKYFQNPPGARITSPAGTGQVMAGGIKDSRLFVLFNSPKAPSGYVLEWKGQDPIPLDPLIK
jgi:hypothetical protein